MTPSRDLSTRLWHRGRLSVVLEPRSWLMGLYVAQGALYACLLPCLAVRWQWRKPDGPGRSGTVPGGDERPSAWLPGGWS